MKRPMKVDTRSAFTMIEFTLVVFISGFLVLGLGTMIEVPRMAIERQEVDPGVSAADRLLGIFDRDVRYARELTLEDPRTLNLVLQDGTYVDATENLNDDMAVPSDG